MPVMPMFPLGLVLMPHMPLDLRIFEERYLKLLGDLLGDENPEFGVVLNGRGEDEQGKEKRFDLGTVALVTDIGTTEEFYGLQSVGGARFRVNSWLPDNPYPIADIDFLPDLVWDEGLAPLLVELEAKVRKLLSFASEFADLQYGADTVLSDDPMEACWQLAGVLPVGQLDQIDLMQSGSAEELLARAQHIADNADDTLHAMIKDQDGNGLTDDED